MSSTTDYIDFMEKLPENLEGNPKKMRRSAKSLGLEDDKELIFKDEKQVYAQVKEMLGDCRCTALCFDGPSRLCTIRGKLRKRVWVNPGDIVLVSMRDFQEGKGDIIHRYSPQEARQLIKYKEIPEDSVDMKEEEAKPKRGDDDGVVFDFENVDAL